MRYSARRKSNKENYPYEYGRARKIRRSTSKGDSPILSTYDTLALYEQGVDRWNKWALDPDNQDRPIDFSNHVFEENTSFAGFKFPGPANFIGVEFKHGANFSKATFTGKGDFQRARFEGNADFRGARFEGNADFRGATFTDKADFKGVTFTGKADFSKADLRGARFEGKADFREATFTGNADFREVTFTGMADFPVVLFERAALFDNTKFQNTADFSGGTFRGPTLLDGSKFEYPPDFRCTEFSKHLTLNGIIVNKPKPAKDGAAARKNDADKFRRLKQLAVEARDHDRELDFFACELMAKRGVETMVISLIENYTLIGNYLYEWSSDFGRSVIRPLRLLLLTWGLSTWYFVPCWPPFDPYTTIGNGLLKSASFLFPFLGAARNNLINDLPLGDLVVGFVSSGIGFICLFLIGLALRNRFRI